jgi:hypothetical protein
LIWEKAEREKKKKRKREGLKWSMQSGTVVLVVVGFVIINISG